MLTVNLTINGINAKVKIHVVPIKYQAIPLIMRHLYTEQEHIEIMVGYTDRAEMNITLMDSMPVHCQPYRVSHYEWQQQDIIQQLMEANIIGEIDSPFSSSMILR
ncbi:hypothetical protein HZH68_000960 [Vespula germanica]|nr:hypothetical protein HZH68_000960 [Vespula germanica]